MTQPSVAFTDRDLRTGAAALMEFASQPEFSELFRDAESMYFGETFVEDLGAEHAREAKQRPECEIGFMTYLLYDMPLEDRTLARRFLAKHGPRMSAGERRYAERMSASQLGLYEVLAVERDTGLDLREMTTKQRIRVRERAATEHLVPGDAIGIRVMQGPDDLPVMDGPLYVFSAAQGRELLAELKREAAAFREEGGDAAFFRKIVAPGIINRFWIDEVLFPSTQSCGTLDGETLCECRILFDIGDRAALRHALDEAPDFVDDATSTDEWLWSEHDDGHITGVVEIEEDRLVGETITLERAYRLKDRIEALTSDAVEFHLIETRPLSTDEAEAIGGFPNEITPEIRDMVYAALSKHYDEWLNDPLPELGNRTPRQAAKVGSVRPKLIALLHVFEQAHERNRAAGIDSHDPSSLWAELGLTKARAAAQSRSRAPQS